MIILDTNVISELMRGAPDPRVIDWVDVQPSESVWITSITVLEARLGLALLPAGRRRQGLELAFDALIASDLAYRVLPFDSAAAEHAAVLAAKRHESGRQVDLRDTQIAGIALSRRASIATRNVRHFADLAVEVIDPWG